MKTHQQWEKDYKNKVTVKDDSDYDDQLEISPEHEKADNWLTETIGHLTEEADEFEYQLERLHNSGKGNKKADEIKQKKEQLEHHRFHISQLQQVQQALDNRLINPTDLQEMMDSVDMYCQSSVCL